MSKCPTCNQPVYCPRDEADQKGFNHKQHCGMLANQLGKVTACWSLRVLGTHRLCDSFPMCPIYKHFVVMRPVGVGGRMIGVFKGGKYDRD